MKRNLIGINYKDGTYYEFVLNSNNKDSLDKTLSIFEPGSVVHNHQLPDGGYKDTDPNTNDAKINEYIKRIASKHKRK